METDNIDKYVTLSDLPTEILLEIFTYLDEESVDDCIRKVCKRFDDILSDEYYWKKRVVKKFGSNIPYAMYHAENEDKWKTLAKSISKGYRLWSNPTSSTIPITLPDVHSTDIDAVHLMKSGSICVAGSRDRILTVWDIQQANKVANEGLKPTPMIINDKAHTGWIWDIASFENNIYSASWDRTIKAWNLGEANLVCTDTYQCNYPVIQLVCKENLIVAGLQNSQINLYDPRKGTTPYSSYNVHRRSVLTLSMQDNIIISGAEDRTLSVWDLRTEKPLRTGITIDSKDSMPLSSTFKNNVIWVGDTRGCLHLVDPITYDIAGSYRVNETGMVTGLAQDKGAVATVCQGRVYMMAPTAPPVKINMLESTIDPTSLDYLNDIVATGGAIGDIQLWIPKDCNVIL